MGSSLMFKFQNQCFYRIQNIASKNFLYEYNAEIPGEFNKTDNSANASHSHRAVFGPLDFMQDTGLFRINTNSLVPGVYIIQNKVSGNVLDFIWSNQYKDNQYGARIDNQLNRAVFQKYVGTSQIVNILAASNGDCAIMGVTSKFLNYWNVAAAHSGLYGFNASSFSLDHQATIEWTAPSLSNGSESFRLFEQCACSLSQCSPPTQIYPEMVVLAPDSVTSIEPSITLLGIVGVLFIFV